MADIGTIIDNPRRFKRGLEAEPETLEHGYGKIFGIKIKEAVLELSAQIKPETQCVGVATQKEERVHNLKAIITKDMTDDQVEELQVRQLDMTEDAEQNFSDSRPFVIFICEFQIPEADRLDIIEEQIENCLNQLGENGVIYIASSQACCDIGEVIRKYHNLPFGFRNEHHWNFYDDTQNGSFVLVKAEDDKATQSLLDIVETQCKHSPYPKKRKEINSA